MRGFMTLCAVWALWASSVCAQAVSEPPLKVLVVTGGHDFNRPAFTALFNGLEGIEWKEAVYGGKDLNATEILGSDAWKAWDVFVFYDMVQGLPEKSLQGLAALPKAGKGTARSSAGSSSPARPSTRARRSAPRGTSTTAT